MQILTVKNKKDFLSLNKNAELFKSGSAVALGFFDGVHIAHRKLINETVENGKKQNIPSVVLTFSAANTSFKSDKARLLTDEEKLSEIQSLGVDVALVFDFDVIKDISAECFVEEILIGVLNAKTSFCGYNFKFGKNASGNSALLEKKMNDSGRKAIVLPEYRSKQSIVSSSYIRNLLSEKKLQQAAMLLGKPFFSDGTVSRGLGLGKKLGFPTVNTSLENGKFTLSNGVYFTAVQFSDKLYMGITNIGECPTFDERETHAETFIFDFDNNIYDEKIRIYFVDFIRNEIKFSSKEELIMQINIDKTKVLTLKEKIKWQEIGLNLQ